MFETQGGTRNRARDLLKKGSAFITSSDHWTDMCYYGNADSSRDTGFQLVMRDTDLLRCTS